MNSETLLEFPCEFPLKVMGRKADDFADLVLGLINANAGPGLCNRVTERISRDGNFVALTVVLQAHSKAQLDTVYAAVSAHDRVLMVL